ncbi:hypothetical protein PVAND_008276 [Polypedilum vanderplanki]|uniref:Uncharacterized protein n=1 Tax=Polypedilum vanderplanki TaxID=319348 RepID=A0A9J6C9P8_POLVA|nr:hypothetical protein PVAND_008276 [Polypedilum vanderplanki]
MQLIRAINKANKSNNNTNINSNPNNNNNINIQTSSTTNNVTNNNNNNSSNKVVIVAPSNAAEKHASQQQQVNQSVNVDSTSITPPLNSVSPSASLPPLKKRTSIVKQSVPPPVPPRSPRSKSKCKSFGHSFYYNFGNRQFKQNSLNVDNLKSLTNMEAESGTQKVKKWLESVEVPECDNLNEFSIHEEFEFKSVKKLVESFVSKDSIDYKKPNMRSSRKVSDCSIVQIHIANYNSLNRNTFNKISNQSTNETDSGIESSLKTSEKLLPLKSSTYFFRHQFNRDGSAPSCSSTPPPAFDEISEHGVYNNQTKNLSNDYRSSSDKRLNSPRSTSSYREDSVSISDIRLETHLTKESTSSNNSAYGSRGALAWTPPTSMEGSTPTWTEGTPSFTESSSSENEFSGSSSPLHSSSDKHKPTVEKALNSLTSEMENLRYQVDYDYN